MFGEQLKKARKNKGIRQVELAKLLNTTNTSVSNWENNFSRPDIDMIKKICSILDISSDFLLEIDEEELTPEEREFISLYKVMDKQGKEVLNYILKQEIKRISVYNKLKSSFETNEEQDIRLVARSKDLNDKNLSINKNIDISKINGIVGDDF